jgi:hypothetical protein
MPILTQPLRLKVDAGVRYVNMTFRRFGRTPIQTTAILDKTTEAFVKEFGEKPNWDVVRFNLVYTTSQIIVELYEG